MRLYFNNGKESKALKFVKQRFQKQFAKKIKQCKFNFELTSFNTAPQVLKKIEDNDLEFAKDFFLVSLETSDKKNICNILKNLWALYLVGVIRAKSFNELRRI